MAQINIVRYNVQALFCTVEIMKNVYRHIALTLKQLRSEREWSLDKAAEETGVSKAMLGQIERGESSPTVATLWKIASGFRAPFSTFISEIDTLPKKTVHRAGKTRRIHPRDKKILVMPIFPFDKKLNFEIFIIELLPGCEHLSPPHKHGVVEHIIVVEGKMEVLADGVWQWLKKGEGLKFNANQPHGYRNLSSDIVCFHDIIHY